MMTGYVKALGLLRRNVRLFLAGSTLLLFALGIYRVVLNLFLVRLGYDVPFIGLINAIGSLSYAAFCLLAGRWARRFGTRRVMIAGTILAAVSFALLALTQLVPPAARSAYLLAMDALGWIAFAIYFVATVPFLMQQTSEAERSHAFSVFVALNPLSGFLGGAAGGVLPGLFAGALGLTLDTAAPYAGALLTGAMVSALAVPLLVATDQPPPIPAERTDSRGAAPPLIAIGAMVLFTLLRVTGENAARTFFNVYLDLVLGVSTAGIGILIAVAQLVAVPAAMASPSAVRRWGEFRAVVLGCLAISASLLPMILVPHWAAAALSLASVMALAAVISPALSIFSQNLVPEEWRSQMSGALNMTFGLSFAGTSFGGGYLITVVGYRPLFATGAVLTCLAALLFWRYFRVPRGEFARATGDRVPRPVAADLEVG